MLASKIAWQSIQPILKKIEQHPFNQQLANGLLKPEIFSFYLSQDAIYLDYYTQAFAYIMAKIDKNYREPFHRYIQSIIDFEKQQVHDVFGIHGKITNSIMPTTATVGYSNFLLSQTATQSAPIGVASILPCFWVYQFIAAQLKTYSCKKNPYQSWIDTYSSDTFQQSTLEAIAIFDQLAADYPNEQQNMQTVFYQSTCWEWHFWNDAYHGNAINPSH